MSDARTQLEELLKSLHQKRDEIRVQVHLGKSELKEEWAALEAKLADLTREYEPVKDAVGETAASVWESLKLVGEEVKQGFDRVRESL